MASDECNECPLCMDPLDFDDLEFYPCSCGYQICRFCWTKIINEENGLCPACRKLYNSENPASFNPMTKEEILKMTKEKRKNQQKKSKISESRKHLSDFRVVQKNLVFVVGLPSRLAHDKELLKGSEHFGKYGNVFKIVVNPTASSNSQSAYVTYCRSEDAMRAILDLRNQQMDGRTLKVSLGTTKYCSQFLRGAKCTKSDCMYLHELADKVASFTKQEMQQGRHTDYEHQLMTEFRSSIPSLLQTTTTPPMVAVSTTTTKGTNHRAVTASTEATTLVKAHQPITSRRKRDTSSSSTNSNPSGAGGCSSGGDMPATGRIHGNSGFPTPLSDSGRSTAASSQGSLSSSSLSNQQGSHSPPLLSLVSGQTSHSTAEEHVRKKPSPPVVTNVISSSLTHSSQASPPPPPSDTLTNSSQRTRHSPPPTANQRTDDGYPSSLFFQPSIYLSNHQRPDHLSSNQQQVSDHNSPLLPSSLLSSTTDADTQVTGYLDNDLFSDPLSLHHYHNPLPTSSFDIISSSNQRPVHSFNPPESSSTAIPISGTHHQQPWGVTPPPLPQPDVVTTAASFLTNNPLLLPQLAAFQQLQMLSAAVNSQQQNGPPPPPGFEGVVPPLLDPNLFCAQQLVAAMQQQCCLATSPSTSTPSGSLMTSLQEPASVLPSTVFSTTSTDFGGHLHQHQSQLHSSSQLLSSVQPSMVPSLDNLVETTNALQDTLQVKNESLGDFQRTLKSMLPHANISFGGPSFTPHTPNRNDSSIAQGNSHLCSIDDPAILMSGQIASSSNIQESFWGDNFHNIPPMSAEQFPKSIWEPTAVTANNSACLDQHFQSRTTAKIGQPSHDGCQSSHHF